MANQLNTQFLNKHKLKYSDWNNSCVKMHEVVSASEQQSKFQCVLIFIIYLLLFTYVCIDLCMYVCTYEKINFDMSMHKYLCMYVCTH